MMVSLPICPSGSDDDPVLRQARKHRAREMLAHLVESEASRLAIGVAPFVAHHAEVVVAILDGDVVEGDVAVLARSARRARAAPWRSTDRHARALR